MGKRGIARILAISIVLFFNKNISAQICNATLTVSNDTSYCIVGSGQLSASVNTTQPVTYQWGAGSGLSNANTATPSFTATSSQFYICVASIIDSVNLVTNGDFENGATNFTSDYVPGTGGTWGLLSNPGTYAIATNANATHTNFASCTDHTSATGNMMVVNGASVANQDVWCQTVAVSPNTLYDFSTWATSVVGNSPANLQFSINGTLIGSSFNLSSTTCTWQNFNAVWNSTTNTSANICIVNQNTAPSGNDFALDDIELREVCQLRDTVNITVHQLGLNIVDTTICQGDTYFAGGGFQTTSGTYVDTLTSPQGCDSFNVTNLTVTSLAVALGNDTIICDGNTLLLDAFNQGASYQWQDASTSSFYIVDTSGTYHVEATLGGCNARDTIEVMVSPLPIVDLGNDTTFCGLSSYMLDATNPNATYQWQDNSTNATLHAQATSNYAVTVTNTDGCTASDDINLTFYEQPMVELGNDTTICQGSSMTLVATQSTSATYLWSNNVTTPTLTVNNTGNYTVTVTIGTCTAMDSIAITLAQNPTVNLGNDTSFCNVNSFLLDATTPNMTYLWQDNSTLSTLNATSTGIYSITITDPNGCTGQDFIALNFAQPPVLDLGPDSIYCNTSSITLNASTSDGIAYLWGDSTTNPIITVDSSGTYFVGVINADQCFSIDSITVGFVTSELVEFGNDTIICEGEILNLNVENFGATYLWQDGSTLPTYDVAQAGAYFVDVTSGGCSDTDTIIVDIEPPLEAISLPSDTTFCNETTITVTAYQPNATNYLWEGFSAYYGQNDPADTSFIITLDGLYTVTVSNGCQSIELTMEVFTEDCGCYPYIPNAFTPNNDGNNDIFRIYSNCQIDNYRLTIYDRWGSLLFQSNDIGEGWNGEFQGNILPNGVYVYVLEYSASRENSTLENRQASGSITIIR